MGILMTDAATVASGAANAEMSTGQAMLPMLLIYALLFGAMWFFFIRPQNKEKKKLAAMLASMEAGDCVLTTSGFYGIIIDIADDTVIVEFGNNKNCRIPMAKTAISSVEKPTDNS